jgi:FMN phosphatase YigB (HAD superfamily)
MAPTGDELLASWNDGPALTAIREFVAAATTEGSPGFVEPDARVAVFDNDGTLWCEKPMPIELGFILRRLAAMADQDPSLRDRQPWKAAYDKDYQWLGDAISRHYAGDDSDLKVLLAGILQAFAGVSVDDYQADAHAFLHNERHPTLGRTFRDCGYKPMVELLDCLDANGFTSYIASGGDRDFMRPVTQAIYRIPAERVIGSSNALRYTPDEDGGSVVYLAEPDVFDDGPVKPVRIWSRVGRRPVVAGGNSNGDIPMLSFAGGPSRPGLRLLVLHDDPDREFDYVAGAERSLEEARARGWTVVSIRRDWATVFDDATDATGPGPARRADPARPRSWP